MAPELIWLVCQDCGEQFDSLQIAFTHGLSEGHEGWDLHDEETLP